MTPYDHLSGREFVNGTWSWNSDRVLLYAVGVDAGLDDPQQELPFTTEPGRARADGFERPIFYGQGSFGVACRALVKALCEGDVTRFGHLAGRFSKPVFPGDRLDTLIWRTADGAQFQMLANGERLVLDRGVFRFR